MRRALIGGVAAMAVLPLGGCYTPQSIFESHGLAADRIAHLSLFMTVLFLVLIVVMWALIAIAFTKRRGTLSEHEPIDIGGGEQWIVWGGIAIPLIVLTLLFVLGLNLLRQYPIHGMYTMHHGGEAKVRAMMKPDIEIIGHQWWWEIHYLNDDPSLRFTTANELHLPAGRPVNIEVETQDVMHSFWIPALHGKVDLIPGQTNYIRLQASDPGSYSGQCAEYCGAEHARMRLLAIVQPEDDYQAWVQGQRNPASQPSTPTQIAGQQVFLSGPCALCHTVRGTIAGGRVAPDLTHIGSREYIAANTYQNNDAYLEAWVTHAQSLKPGAKMPDLTQFSGEQLHDLVAYLRQLQ